MSEAQLPAANAKQVPRQQSLRRNSRAARAAMTNAERQNASAIIVKTVVHSHWFRRAKLLACYLSTDDEVDTWLLIERAWRMKKRIFAPVINKKGVMYFCEITPESKLFLNHYGLYEPREGELIAPRQLDLVITPVVSFDNEGNRIGMGGGYFDRTFSFLRHRKHLLHPKLVGLAFACQRVEKITANPWDIQVFRVIDETS
jgi:5-formyltetrahydrofolate cyclo-ligase